MIWILCRGLESLSTFLGGTWFRLAVRGHFSHRTWVIFQPSAYILPLFIVPWRPYFYHSSFLSAIFSIHTDSSYIHPHPNLLAPHSYHLCTHNFYIHPAYQRSFPSTSIRSTFILPLFAHFSHSSSLRRASSHVHLHFSIRVHRN